MEERRRKKIANTEQSISANSEKSWSANSERIRSANSKQVRIASSAINGVDIVRVIPITSSDLIYNRGHHALTSFTAHSGFNSALTLTKKGRFI